MSLSILMAYKQESSHIFQDRELQRFDKKGVYHGHFGMFRG